jgi:hypothetical protein
VVLAAAGRQTEWHLSAEARNLGLQSPKIKIYPTLPCAVAAYENGEIAEANQIVDLV